MGREYKGLYRMKILRWQGRKIKCRDITIEDLGGFESRRINVESLKVEKGLL